MNQNEISDNLLVLGVGVSVHKNDGLLRFEHFCKLFDYEYQILGAGKEWLGGDMAAGPGGGQKINELMSAIKDMDNRLIIICDTFDLIPIASKKEFMQKFKKLYKPNHIIFSAEVFCWPNKMLANSYPDVNSKFKFLNSGSIIGYRDDIYKLLTGSIIRNNEDDQLFYTLKYLAGEKIILDVNCEIFQAVNGAQNDLIVHKNRLYNSYTKSYPIFIHGNGPAKTFLNQMENYIHSGDEKLWFANLDAENKLISEPSVFFALYANTEDEADFDRFFDSVMNIEYTNKIIYVYDEITNSVKKEELTNMGVNYIGNIKKYIYDDFIRSNCEYYFLLEQRSSIIDTNILHHLIPYCNGYHRVISPLLLGENTFTNFWGALSQNGYYERSSDYIDLINYKLTGIWNVPHVCGVILLRRDVITNWDLSQPNAFNDNDMQLTSNLRQNTLFMYMINLDMYGMIK